MGKQAEQPGNGSPSQKDASGIRTFLDLHRGEKHVVVLQSYPDPDAISCAFAYQVIAKKWDIQADMVYPGRISHQENIALVKLVGLNLIPYAPGMDLGKYQGAVFVDNQGTTSEPVVKGLEEAGVPPLLIIDHHEYQGRIEAPYTDIRRTGAAATIFVDYIQQGMLEMNKEEKEHVSLATALMHGVMTDTGNFIRATSEDLCAASFLSRYRDPELLLQIVTQSRSKQTMGIIHRALVNRVTVENFSIAGIGYLRSEDRDVIPQAADFLLTEENIHTVIVYGIVTEDDHQERVVGSMRTAKLTIDPNEFIRDMFGKDINGSYFGGGKVSAGGFEIPVGFLSGGNVESYRELKWQVYDKQIKQKAFAKIGIEKNP